ncbi:MAG TPA: hypothetical protein VJA86_03965 [Candidatus Nanoarchaeia archaeon]|nr:hypothetical protein [Candidatus Nanoarchaeia archaeon]
MAEFGLKKKESTFEYRRGKYTIFYTSSRSFSGMLKDIEDGWLLLHPFQGFGYDAEKGLIKKLVDDEHGPMKVRINDVTGIEPVTREDMIAYCEYSNKHPEKDGEKSKEEKESK